MGTNMLRATERAYVSAGPDGSEWHIAAGAVLAEDHPVLAVSGVRRWFMPAESGAIPGGITLVDPPPFDDGIDVIPDDEPVPHSVHNADDPARQKPGTRKAR